MPVWAATPRSCAAASKGRGIRATTRTSFGFRVVRVRQPYGDTTTLPIFEKLVLGGEYAPADSTCAASAPGTRSGLVLGGNKTLLFNADA